MRMSEKDFNDVMDANIKSVFNMTKLVVGTMLKAKSGSIINMSSVVGVKGNIGQSNYAASKAAINGFTKSIAQNFGSRNIRCNSIAPGFIQTEMTESLDQDAIKKWTDNIPLKRGGTVEDIAKNFYVSCVRPIFICNWSGNKCMWRNAYLDVIAI